MADLLSEVFAALADPTRRDIVARLSTADATVGELAAPYDVSVQAISKHSAAASTFTHPHAGTHRLDDAIDRFYTSDVFMHTWDLATANGTEPGLDPGFCTVLVEGMEPIDELLRSSGQYGPRVPVADDADAMTRLIGFIGRNPNWHRPH